MKDRSRSDEARERMEGRIQNALAVFAINDEIIHEAGDHLLNAAMLGLPYDPECAVLPVRRVLAEHHDWDRVPVSVQDGDDIEYAKGLSHHRTVDGFVDHEPAVIFLLDEHEGYAYLPLSR